MLLDHFSEEGPAELEEIKLPFSTVLLFSVLLTISYGIHFDGHFLHFWITSQDFVSFI